MLICSEEYLETVCELATSSWARMPLPPSETNATIRSPMVLESLSLLSLKRRRPFDLASVIKVPNARMISIACQIAGNASQDFEIRVNAITLVNALSQASRVPPSMLDISALLSNDFFKISAELMKKGCAMRDPQRILGVEHQDEYDNIALLWLNIIRIADNAGSSVIAKDFVKNNIILVFGEWSLKALDSQLEDGQHLCR